MENHITPAASTNVAVGFGIVVSFILGATTSYFLTKREMEKKYESLIAEEVSKAKAFYSQRNKTGEFSDPIALAEELVGDPFVDEPDDDFIVVDGKPFRDMDPGHHVNYSKLTSEYGSAKDGETVAEYEQRVIAETNAKDLEDREEEVEMSNVFETHGVDVIKVSDEASRIPGKPYVITVTEFTDNDLDYGQNAISYYTGDQVLADERDQPIPNIDYVVGRHNLRFGDGSGDPNIVFVRNEELGVDFEICQSLGTYSEEVLGVAPAETRSKRPH